MSHNRHRKISKNSYEYNRKYGKKKKWLKALIIIGIILALLIGLSFFGIHYLKGGLKRVNINKENLGIVEISSEENAKKHNITNIAVFGFDSRDITASYGDQGRSDSIIILSVDKTGNSIKLISVLRYSMVPIEGNDPHKINAA